MNKWNKFKYKKILTEISITEPIFFADQAAREAAFVKGCCGLTNIPCFRSAADMRDWMKGKTSTTYPSNSPGLTKAASWSWRKPTIARLGDFNNYSHIAKGIASNCFIESEYVLPTSGSITMEVQIRSDSHEINLSDLCQKGVMLPYGTAQHSEASHPENLRLGVCIIDNNTTSPKGAMIIRPTLLRDEPDLVLVSIDVAKFNQIFTSKGRFTTFLFMVYMETPPTGIVQISNQQGVFYPINSSEKTLNYSGGRVQLSITGNANYKTNASVDVTLSVKNVSAVGVYIETKLELRTGTQLVDSWEDTRRWLAANATINASRNMILRSDNGMRVVDVTIYVYETNTATNPIDTRTAQIPVYDPNAPEILE